MVRPQRTADPAECLALAKRDGAAILTGVGTGSKAAVTAMALDVIGEHALGIQSPGTQSQLIRTELSELIPINPN
eukprot:SAG31_NODE_444_length_15625_cov_6.047469_11_plen_75_part_00